MTKYTKGLVWMWYFIPCLFFIFGDKDMMLYKVNVSYLLVISVWYLLIILTREISKEVKQNDD